MVDSSMRVFAFRITCENNALHPKKVMPKHRSVKLRRMFSEGQYRLLNGNGWFWGHQNS